MSHSTGVGCISEETEVKKLLLAGTTVVLMATGTVHAAEKTQDELQQEENYIWPAPGLDDTRLS